MDEIINYEEMVQDALRNVIRETIKTAAEEGLPGAHHFYISFRTDFPGVQLSESLRERHPEEMTIVIQHQFWGLEVDDNGFYVTLSFSDSQERIYAPFLSLLSFTDPYAKFGLQFSPPSSLEEVEGQKDSSQDSEEKENKDNVITLDKFRKT